jgi:ferredoxin-NADP reductase
VTAVAAERELETLLADKVHVADGVVALTLRSPTGDELPEWAPGAHIDLILPGGLTRQYSLCGDPADRSAWRVAVLREPDGRGRGGSRYVHDDLDGGVRIRGPRNHFPLLPAERYAFVAGGIGITPILPMVARAEAEGAPWRLLYGGRTRSSMAFLDVLAQYGDKVVVAPQDETGLLDLAAWLPAPEAGTRVYCCGPEPLLAAVEDRCASWAAGALQTERFTRRAVALPVLAEGFEVVLSASGHTLTVPPGRSILEVVEASGVPVLSSCQEGTCGTCETAVLEGVPDHRDSVLSGEERAAGDVMMICVSRSCTDRLVLDL